MNRDWGGGPVPQGYTVTHFDRGHGNHNPLHSMAGPEFTGVGAVYAPLGLLPLGLRLVAVAALLLVAMAGCTAAWVDYQDYTPSPNVCRSANSGIPQERSGSCTPATGVDQ